VTTADAVFVIIVVMRHELFLLVGGPSIGPDETEIDGANDLFPHEGSQNKKTAIRFAGKAYHWRKQNRK
jgi:hypothetical protein